MNVIVQFFSGLRKTLDKEFVLETRKENLRLWVID
jgi:hypothetical protein